MRINNNQTYLIIIIKTTYFSVEIKTNNNGVDNNITLLTLLTIGERVKIKMSLGVEIKSFIYYSKTASVLTRVRAHRSVIAIIRVESIIGF